MRDHSHGPYSDGTETGLRVTRHEPAAFYGEYIQVRTAESGVHRDLCSHHPHGFARFSLWAKNLLFMLLFSTLFLPQVVLNVPQYILFNEVVANSYLPIVIPSMLAGDTFFVYMLIQFLRGFPGN